MDGDAKDGDAKPDTADRAKTRKPGRATKRPAPKRTSPATSSSTMVSKPPPAPNNILILDPGFRSLTGHHYNNNVAITRAASEIGRSVRILAGDSLQSSGEIEATVDRFFESDLYGGANFYQESWELDSWLVVNSQFGRDLARIPADALDWADLILVPAITQFHLFATARFLASTLNRRPGQRAAINLMFSPTWTAWDSVCSSGPQMYVESIKPLAGFGRDRVAYFSELPASCREYEPLLGFLPEVLPHPGIWPDAITRKRPPPDESNETIRVGYFGYAKREKGFHLVPGVYDKVRRAFAPDEVEFVIHVNHGGYDGSIIAADEALSARDSTGLRILRGAISSEVYMQEFLDSDIALLPYDPNLYRGRGSGVFSEAIGLGKILVAPRAAGVGEELEAGRGAGVLFDKHTAEDVADAVIRAVETFKTLSATSTEQAPIWRDSHSGRALLDILANAFSGTD